MLHWFLTEVAKTYIKAGDHQPKLTLESMTNDGA